MAHTLISFLGTGRYEETTYSWPEAGQFRTRYAPAAIAELWGADRIVVLCTAEARAIHAEGLADELRAAGLCEPSFREMPSGRSEQELWAQFEAIRGEIVRSFQDEVMLDITHGFRAQPFFAGAVISLLQASGHRPRNMRVVYGEFRKGEQTSPIWDLSLFVDLMDWSRALDLFLRTGRADPVSDLGRQLQKSEAERAKSVGDRDFPRFGGLIGAIESFANDLATVRVAHIITGYEQKDSVKHKARGSAAGLLDAIERHREEARERIPQLALVLDRLEETVRPLVADSLLSDAGQQAQYNLVKLYRDLERYPEAATVLREARVNLYALDERAVEVNSAGFDKQRRKQADDLFGDMDPSSKTIAAVRNDVNHGGFREQPFSGSKLIERVRALIWDYADTGAREMKKPVGGQAHYGLTYFVSRHPGAVEWAREQGFEVDHWMTHIDPESVQHGDTVIGSLPVHLVARVCARGGRYFHLSLDLPEDWRGRELSAEELRACNARLYEYHVLGFSERDDGE